MRRCARWRRLGRARRLDDRPAGTPVAKGRGQRPRRRRASTSRSPARSPRRTARGVVMTGTGDFQNSPQLGSLTMTIGVVAKTISMDRGDARTRIGLHDLRPPSPAAARAGKDAGCQAGPPEGRKGARHQLLVAHRADAGLDAHSSSRAPGTSCESATATINGVATTQYRATIDVTKIPNGKKLVQLNSSPTSRVQVYVDKAGLLRRIHMAYTSPVKAAAPT